MRKLRGGSGLGDSIYLRPIVDHMISKGDRVTVKSSFPDVFIDSGAIVQPFDKKDVNVIAHYHRDRQNQGTHMFADMLRCAGLPDIALRFDWKIRNQRLVDELRADAEGDPLILVHGARAPFGRSDGYGTSLKPDTGAFYSMLGVFADCFTIRVGKGDQDSLPVGMDLTGVTTVSDLIDIFAICDGVITQCGFPVPLAECFDKPLLALWSSRGLASGDKIISSITPAKVLSKATSRAVLDNVCVDAMHSAARAWRDDMRLYADALA